MLCNNAKIQVVIIHYKIKNQKGCIFSKGYYNLYFYKKFPRGFFLNVGNITTSHSNIQPCMSYRASHWTNGGAVKKIYIVKVRIYVSINWRNNFLLLKKNLKSYDGMHLTCTSTKYIYVYIHYCLQFRTHKFFFLSSI